MNQAGTRSDPPAPQYMCPGAHVPSQPAPQQPGPRTYSVYPPPPPYPGLRTHNACPPDGGRVGLRATSDKSRREAQPTALQSETRIWKWTSFLVGNLISVAGIVYEIAGLEEVCIDWSDDDINEQEFDDEDDDTEAITTYDWLMLTLIIGLWVDVFSAVSLSAVYRSPLDIKSAYKIPPEDSRNSRMLAIINFLAPFSWGVVYFCGAFGPALEAGLAEPCEGAAGWSGLADLLVVSGMVMMIIGFGMLVLSGHMAQEACSCCPCCPICSSVTLDGHMAGSPRCCCITWSRKTMHEKILTKSWAFDLVWQLQGVLISYRLRTLSLIEAVVVLLSAVSGSALATLGSVAPEEVIELVGPSS